MFKVRIWRHPFTDALHICFLENRNGKNYYAKPILLELVEYPDGGAIESTLELHGDFGKNFLQAMAEALDRDGVKTEKDFKIQGLMEATKFHLEDMRKLVFGKSK